MQLVNAAESVICVESIFSKIGKLGFVCTGEAVVALAVLLPSHMPAVLPAGEYAAALQVTVVRASQGLVTVRGYSNGS